jgi:hypothetical protein
MSTLSNISPPTSSNTAQEEQGTANGLQKSSGVTGLFEEVMAQMLSSSAQLKSVQVDPKTSGKANTKSASGSSVTNSHLPIQIEQGNAVVNPEITVSQMLAAAISMASPTGKEVMPDVSSASTQTGATTKSSGISASLLQVKGNATAATKISASDLSENQTASSPQVPVVQKVNQLAGKEAGAGTKNPEISIPVDSNASASKLEKADPEPDSSSSNGPDPGGGTVTPLQSNPGGTSIAKQDVAMKQVEKTNNIAGQTEKVLPGSVVSATKASPTSYFSTNSDQLTATAAANSSQTDSSSATSTLPLDAVDGSITADMRTRTLERTQEMVTVNATRLTESGNNSMQVVIKPDAGTQLSLELRQQGGSVHVQAVLQQGDFGHLNQQWSDLQHRLGQRGIQLAPLTDDAGSANSNSGETFQNKQNQTTEGVPEVTFADAPIGMFTAEATPAPAHRGWETWA